MNGLHEEEVAIIEESDDSNEKKSTISKENDGKNLRSILKIEPNDDDVMYNLSHSSYEQHPGNYRLKRLILDNPEYTAEIIYLRYQILYPNSRFLERSDYHGWEIMSKDKVLKIIFSRLKYGYREHELTRTPTQYVEIRDLPFDIDINDVCVHRESMNKYYVPSGNNYRNIICTHRGKNQLRTPSKVNEIATEIVSEVASLDPPGNFYVKNHEDDSPWEKISKQYSVEITSYFLMNGFETDGAMIVNGDSNGHVKGKIILDNNDVIPIRFKPDQPGTLYYYALVDQYLEDTKVDTFSAVAGRIIDEIKSQNPPGRFLKYVGKGEWEEQNEASAVKKIQKDLSSRSKPRRKTV